MADKVEDTAYEARKKGKGKKRSPDLHETAKKRFALSAEYWQDVRVLGIEDHKFAIGNADNGYQWPDAYKKEREKIGSAPRPCLTINRIPAHIAQVTNEQRQNRPQIKVRAVNDEGDPDVAEIINGIVRHIHNNVNDVYEGGDIAITTASEHQVRCGLGYVQICTDYCDDETNDQDIFFRRIADWTTIYDDPSIRTVVGRDRKFLFETVMIDEDEYELMYPEAEPVHWASIGSTDADWYDSGSKRVRVAKYWYVKEKKETIKVGDKERKVTKRTVHCATLSGSEVIEEYDFPGQYIPFARVVGNESMIEGKPEISGLTRGGKDAQRMFNYGRSAQAEHIGLAPKAPFVAPAEAMAGFEDVWNTANTVAYSNLPYNAYDVNGQPLPAPQRASPTMPNSALSEMVGQSAEDIKATFGQFDAAMGKQSNETSGRAIIARQKEGDTATYHYLDNLAHAVKFCGDIIVGLVPHIYDTKRVARIIGADDAEDYALINPAQKKAIEKITQSDGTIRKSYNLSVGKYDVVVSVGPSYASKRQEGLAFLTEAGAKIPELLSANMDLLAKLSDNPYSEEMAKRAKVMLPPPVLQMLQAEKEQEGLPPEAIEIANQAKQEIAKRDGQIQAQQEALDQTQQQTAMLNQQLKDKTLDRESNEKLEVMKMNLEQEHERLNQELARMKLELEIFKERNRITSEQQARQMEMHPIVERDAQRDQMLMQTLDQFGQSMQPILTRDEQRDQMLHQALMEIGLSVGQAMGQVAQAIEGLRAQSNEQNQAIMQGLMMLIEKRNQPRSVEMKSPSGQTYTATVQ